MKRSRNPYRVAIAVIVVLSLVIPQFTFAGAGPAVNTDAEDRQPAAMKELADQLADQSDPFDYTREADRRGAVQAADREFPSSFDLRDADGVSYVSPVKFQDPWGNCWGFAAIAAAETSILGDEELRGNYSADIRKEEPGSGKVQLDLSEKHLTYFSTTPINDPNDPQNGEGEAVDAGPGEDPVAAAYNLGGFAPTATAMFAAGMGPVLESEDPVFEYRGRKGMIDKQWVDGRLRNYCYSSTDDWTIDEKLRFSNSFSLGESFLLPSPAVRAESEEGDADKYEYEAAGTAAIKAQVYNRRGVQIGYKEDSFVAAYSDHGRYINSNYAHYTYTAEAPSHAVCIVGWDDNYPAENFRHAVDEDEDGFTEADTVPPGNGAWLVKNSWGSGEEEFPDRGDGTFGITDPETGLHTGYFWLSYYDQSIGTPEALDFEKNSAGSESYTNVTDQHDLARIKEYRSAHIEGEVKTANVFMARVCEKLKKISCETTYPGTEVTFDVYLLAKEAESPVDGILMDSVSAVFEYGGLHKVSLNKPFIVMRGQSYAVVVTQKVPVDGGGRDYAVALQASSGKTVVNKGESFLFADGKWQDLSDEALRTGLLDESTGEQGAAAVDNFPIKGYGEEKSDVVIALDYSGEFSLPGQGSRDISDTDVSETYYLMWLVDSTGSDDSSTAVPVWTVADGGLDIINIADGRDITRKTITCRKPGWTYLTVSIDGIGTAVSRIQVTQPPVQAEIVRSGSESLVVKRSKIKIDGLDGIELAYRAKGEETWSVREYGPESEELELTGLSKGKTYEVRARSFVDTQYGKYYSKYGTAVEGKTDAGKESGTDVSTADRTDAGKAVNTLKTSGRKVTVKYSKAINKNVRIAGKKALTVSGAEGRLTYKKVSVSCRKALKRSAKKIKVNKKSGGITLKKGLRKGTYKVKVKVFAAGSDAYEPGSSTAVITIRIK